MFNWLYNILNKKLWEKKHNVLKLEWEKAELEAKLKRLKENQRV